MLQAKIITHKILQVRKSEIANIGKCCNTCSASCGVHHQSFQLPQGRETHQFTLSLEDNEVYFKELQPLYDIFNPHANLAH